MSDLPTLVEKIKDPTFVKVAMVYFPPERSSPYTSALILLGILIRPLLIVGICVCL